MSKMCRISLFVTCGLLSLVCSIPLPTLNINSSTITLSGGSAGGALATQLHIAYSSMFSGAALIASPPFACAKMNLVSTAACMTLPLSIVTADLEFTTFSLQELGLIDPTKNLAHQRVWIFSGTKDTVVYQGVVKKQEEYYRLYMPSANIATKYDIPAAHSLATNNSMDNACDFLGIPFINYCQYDSVREFLRFILFEPNNIYAKEPARLMKRENLIKFEQKPYIPSSVLIPYMKGLHDFGYLYVPDACKNGTTVCHLHVSLHGCLQNDEFSGMAYFERTGINEWAETNNIVVLYPQAHSIIPYSALACWDWFGYTGPAYTTNEGIQMQSIRNMIKALLGK